MNYQLFLQIFGKRYWKQRLLISANAIKLHKLFHNHPNGDSSLFWPLLERHISFVLLKWKTMICLRELIINVCYFIVGKKKIEKKWKAEHEKKFWWPPSLRTKTYLEWKFYDAHTFCFTHFHWRKDVNKIKRGRVKILVNKKRLFS